MGSYRHLSREDREEIAVLRAAGAREHRGYPGPQVPQGPDQDRWKVLKYNTCACCRKSET